MAMFASPYPHAVHQRMNGLASPMRLPHFLGPPVHPKPPPHFLGPPVHPVIKALIGALQAPQIPPPAPPQIF